MTETLPKLTLFEIETQLLALMEAREDAEREGDPEAVAVIDGELRKYVEAEVRKVDGIAAYIREGNARADILADEAERLSHQAKAWQKKADKLRALTLEIMQNAGERKLSGRHSILRRIGNGGKKPLVITQPELVPDAYRRVNVGMTYYCWLDLCEAGYAVSDRSEAVTDNAVIRAALECGVGVPGCRLAERGEHLEIA